MKTYTILIVDDNTTNIKVLGSLLKANNYNVEFALNGQSAIDWIKKNDFDLILLDVMMPDMDGFEVASILKDRLQKKDIPIIFLTAKNDEESILKGFESGAVDFLTKPFNHNELLARVSTHVTLKNALEKIKEKDKLIAESVYYAKMLQNVLIPTNELNKIFNDGFIVNFPDESPDRDYHWITHKNGKVLLAILHGNGNNLSVIINNILKISLLNEITHNYQNYNIHDVLNTLRTKIKTFLEQNGSDKEVEMDISLCIFDMNLMQLEYSGALSSISIFRKGELIESVEDHQLIDTQIKNRNLSSITIEIEVTDRIYITSDNIKNQLGERPDLEQFKNLIQKIQKDSIQLQGKKIETFLKNWIGTHVQTGNIKVLGIQI